MWRLLRGEAEHLVLARPFGWQVAETGNSHASGSRPSIAALTRSGARKASEIVMLILRTLHPSRLAMLSVCCWIGDKFFEPTAPAGDRCDQGGAGFRTYRTGVLRRLPSRAQEFHGAALILSYAKGHEGAVVRSRLLAIAFRASASWMTSCSGWTSTRAT